MPPKTRASTISAIASEKLANERVPGRISEVRLKAVFSPNSAERMNAADPLYVECADGYSGWAGVPVRVSSHGCHVGSASAGGRTRSVGPARRPEKEGGFVGGARASDRSCCPRPSREGARTHPL